MSFKDRVVLITGGANGIGKAIAKAYCKAGARVIVADIDEINGKLFKSQYREEGYDLSFKKVDIKYERDILNLFDYISNSYGRVDILINNAGISKFKPLEEVTVDEWDEVLNVNLRSMFITSREFTKLAKNSGGGKIVNISSTRYLMSEHGSEAYAASKGGVVSLTHALALSLSRYNIQVNCISPGWIENGDYSSLRDSDHKQHPSGRVGKPEDIAKACLFLTSRDNDFINGENLVIDGGMTKKMIYMD